MEKVSPTVSTGCSYKQKLVERKKITNSTNKKGLYVDDIRNPPQKWEDWDIARNYSHAIELLTNNYYESISLDHDIASYQNGVERTGYDIVKWLCERKVNGETVPDNYYIHTANPVGRSNMEQLINRYLK